MLDEGSGDSDENDPDDEVLEGQGFDDSAEAENEPMLEMGTMSGIDLARSSVTGKRDSGTTSVPGTMSKSLLQLQSGLRRSDASPVNAVQATRTSSGGGDKASSGSGLEHEGSKSMRQTRSDMQQRALDKARANMRSYSNSSTFVCKSIACLLLPVSTVLLFAGALLLI